VVGEAVATVETAVDQPGAARISWSIRDVASGVYLYRLTTEGSDGKQDYGLNRFSVVH
jgi:hypothetical protein